MPRAWATSRRTIRSATPPTSSRARSPRRTRARRHSRAEPSSPPSRSTCPSGDNGGLRLARTVFLVLVVLVLALGAAGWLYLRQSLPALDGEIRTTGLAARV